MELLPPCLECPKEPSSCDWEKMDMADKTVLRSQYLSPKFNCLFGNFIYTRPWFCTVAFQICYQNSYSISPPIISLLNQCDCLLNLLKPIFFRTVFSSYVDALRTTLTAVGPSILRMWTKNIVTAASYTTKQHFSVCVSVCV